MANLGNARLLKFNNPNSSLVLPRLHDQRKTGLFCDVVLHVGSQSYAAHKNLLAASSLYFESLFLTKSSVEREVDAAIDKGPIHVTIDSISVCPKSFCAILDYLYLGHISVEATGVTDVLMLAEEFYLDSLKDYCNAYLECLRKSNSCLSDARKSLDVDQQAITEGTSTEDHSEDDFISAIDDLKYEIKSENDETDCDFPSQTINNRIPVMCKSKRKDGNYSNGNVTKRKQVVPEVLRVLGNCKLAAFVNESTSNNCRNGERNLLESQAMIDKRKILRKSSREEMVCGNFPRKTIIHHNLRVKLKSSSTDGVILSESCMKQENQVEETFKPDLKVNVGGNNVDSSQDHSSPTLKCNRKRPQARLNDGKRKTGKSCNKSDTDGKGRFAQRISCFWCSFKCLWKRELAVHVAALHFPEPPYKCDKCDDTLEGVEELLKHKKIHSLWENPFECTVCKKLFQFKYALNLHMRCHTGEKAFMCPVCGHSFSTKANLNEHILTHGDYRPYLCHLCTYSTKHQSLLTDHQRMHSGELFHCEAPNCKYTATRRSKITSHMRCHLDVRPHVCRTCAKAFTRKGHLMRHERLHLNVRPFACNGCPETFSRAENLKAHRKKCCPELVE